MSAPYAVAGRDIEFTYASEAGPVPVLRGASVSAAPGEIVLVKGPSGSGKTTLLSALAGMLTPDAGSVAIEGREITTLSRGERTRLRLARLGFVFQGFNLIGALTARENVELLLAQRGLSRAEVRRRSDAMFERLGLEGKGERRPAQLSGGEKQRVAVARALAGDPAVVMADEPTSSLDAQNGAVAMRLLCELARERGAAVIITSHDERIVPLVDRTLTLAEGRC
ncbi:MAG TPA: ABC transporter ATP-binding protein [Candidatus Baltobacteraceae bacterium]|nr:ABC transporter ATP-binding protein [Candidatus Baltobacteraceae bacterium]